MRACVAGPPARSPLLAVGRRWTVPREGDLRTRTVTWLNHLGAVPITIGMTLFPSAFRSDRLWATGTPARPVKSLRNLVRNLIPRARSVTTPVLTVVSSRPDRSGHERPEPRLKWTDPRRAPEGDFTASAILNVELASVGVPRRGDPWEVVSDFALSYDGYGYWDDLHELAKRVLQRWTRFRSLPATLDELRGCLFHEQRRWHHFGEDPSGRSAEYMWTIIDAIAALAAPVTSTTHRSDPRLKAGHETHVTLLATPAETAMPADTATSEDTAASADAPRHVARPTPLLRPVPASLGRLVPVAATEAHVRLVSVIEGESVSRLPSGWSSKHRSEHPSVHASQHPSVHESKRSSTSTTIRDLLPMPSAEPLAKPPVITRRPRTGPGGPNRPGDVVRAVRSPADAHPSNGTRRSLEPVPGPSREAGAQVTPLCHEFCDDDPGYLAWVASHPDGYVLNQPRLARAKAPTLHRVGCAALAPRDGADALTAGAVKVCGPSAGALEAWSTARGAGRPRACRRCSP